MNVLVSGASSGLGRYLKRKFRAKAFSRFSPDERPDNYDVIIHCAQAPMNDPMNLYNDFHECRLLAKRLLNWRPKKFVFISSVDVYPKGCFMADELLGINPSDVIGAYAISKLMVEGMVQAMSENWLILRCGALLGPDMRSNHFTRMFFGPVQIGLSPASSFNYVRYEDVAALIEAGMQVDGGRIVNCISSHSVTLGALSRDISHKVDFGLYTYKTPSLSNGFALGLCPSLDRDSEETVAMFLKEHGKKFGR